MNCLNCNGVMKKVKIIGDLTGMGVYIADKEKGFLGAERRAI